MELDFGPTEPPSQPPTNPPPAGDEPKVGPVPLSTLPVPPAPPKPPTPPPAGPTTETHPTTEELPIRPRSGRGKTVLLIVGVVIIVAGLGYLAFALLGGASAPPEEVTEITETPGELPTGLAPATPTSPTPSTPAATPTTVVPAPAPETVQTRDAIRKKDLATIQTYLESYFNDKAAYPTAAKFAKLNDPASPVITALVPKYTAALPRDPKDPEFFYGYKSVDGKGYTLTARLENTADPEGRKDGDLYLYSVTK